MGKQPDETIPALTPNGRGHQFVLYGDSCSGVAGAPHEKSHAAVNRVVSLLAPKPEFIIFPGDEVIGLTGDEAELRRQWSHWLENEMAWLDRNETPLYNSTGNHTTYGEMSERVFADVLAHLPRNGAPGQEGLSYFVRNDDLLLIFIHTLCAGMGGEGHVETRWLEATLKEHAGARWKFVIGHHPTFAVNGFAGDYVRQIGSEYRADFWRILRQNGVLAYLCSHILAFDTQIHDGVLQITTAGAGTAHRMPEGVEYLHAVQLALDDDGLRYQVLDTDGHVRERLAWPFELPPATTWPCLSDGEQPAPATGQFDAARTSPAIFAWTIRGRTAGQTAGRRQTLLSANSGENTREPFWMGLSGKTQQLTITLQPEAGRSPHYWLGPRLNDDENFCLQIAIHSGMGPGGIMVRHSDRDTWSSMPSSSSWGAERLQWPDIWNVSTDANGDLPFLGDELRISAHVQAE